jgi:hypothetical protein
VLRVLKVSLMLGLLFEVTCAATRWPDAGCSMTASLFSIGLPA